MIRASEERLTRGLALILAAALVVSLAGFYLLPSGKLNSFPTYVAALAALLLIALDPRAARGVAHSRAALVGVLLLAYLVGVTASMGGVESALQALRYSALIAIFLLGVSVCVLRFRSFVPVLVRVLVICAALSALHYLLGVAYADDVLPWGRLRIESVAASVYGLGAALAFGLALSGLDLLQTRDGSSVARRRVSIGAWALAACVLCRATWLSGESYVVFGLLTACLVVSIALAWAQRLSPKATYWLPIIAGLMIVQIMVFNSVMDTGRPLIWQGAVDDVFEGDTLFGAGFKADIEPSVICEQGVELKGFSDCKVDHVHSIYVSTLHHGGVLGLGLLVLLVLLAASDVLELPPGESRTVTLIALAYGMTVLMFDGQTIIRKVDFIWLLFWLPIALAGGLRNEARRAG